MRIVLTVIFTLSVFTYWAQRPSELIKLQELYPEHDYVVIKDHTNINISMNKEKEVEIIKTNEMMIYLTSDRAGFFKKDRIYSSYFERLIDKEAYALNKKKDKDQYSKESVREFNSNEAISEDVFFDDGIVTSFTYEGLKKESVINLKYTKKLIDPHLSFSGFFGSSYPLLDKSLTITVEDVIDMSTVYFNMDVTDVNYTKERSKNKTIYKWHVDTVEIYKTENSSPNIRYYIPHLISRINNYSDKEGNKVGVLENVQDLFDWYLSLVNQVKCESNLGLQAIVDEIISPEDSELEKVKKVFQWVQGNVKYIAIEDGLGGFIPRDPDLVLNRRYGDCKDMATLIVELLKIQGIKAHQVWIGTIDIPYKYEEIPSPVIDNHMIAAYFDQQSNAYIFLDATDDKIAFGYPSSFIQGKEALINVDNNYKIVEVPVLAAEKTLMADTIQLFIDNDKLTGKGKLNITGYYAGDFKSLLKRVKDEKGIKSKVEHITKKGSNKFHLDNYKMYVEENKVSVDYEFSVPSYVNKTENEVYVNMSLQPLLDFFTPYDVDDRKTAVTEKYATQTNFVYTLEIPEGYKIDYVPENVSVDGGDVFRASINYNTATPGKITYSFDLRLNYILLDVEQIKNMTDLGKILKGAHKETLILKKIEE
ncbi:MAG TPA: transglutaminase domain-containing protein [Brumimicrobium sp.]|nr:transglutaminase domain-containing protein [Brumimicrobium sp.]